MSLVTIFQAEVFSKMSNHNYLMEIIQKLGKDQQIRKTKEILCPVKNDDESAITNDEKILKDKCFKCYLCLAFDKKTGLDEDGYPVPLKEDRKKVNIDLNEEDYDMLDSVLSKDEVNSLSKWVYGVFKSFGFEVYKEVGIPNESLPAEIVQIYGVSDRKNKRADLELDSENLIFVFENKPYSADLQKWLIGKANKDGLNQLNYYSHSSLYQKANLVLCYNSRVKKDVIAKIKIILKDEKNILVKNNIKKLIVLNTYELYKVFIKNLDTKDKSKILDLLKANEINIE